MRFTLTFASVLLFSGFGSGPVAMARDSGIASPTAVATSAEVSYCFARLRGLDPDRLPPAYLALQLRVAVSYSNAAARPVILPLPHLRTIYAGFKPGETGAFKEGPGLFAPALKPMEHLPPGVSPDNPIDPKNDAFTIIPARGEVALPLWEELTLPVSPQGLFKRRPDLRGHKVYVELQFKHQELRPALQAYLSDRWSRFGIPWTGTLTTNAILIDVPADPPADGPCRDIYSPARQAVGLDHMK
jgi:hypothetical protein